LRSARSTFQAIDEEGGMNIADEIKRLHELHQSGALTDAEFELAKRRLLGSGPAQPGSGADLVDQLNRLRRSKSDRWLGGVCGGLARATGLESWIWRLLFVLFTLSVGIGLVAYLLAWIFIPEEP
jgi:phage shock protein C